MLAMPMLTDNPILSIAEDKYDFRSYADILASTIRETQRLPFCLGIFGEWGCGKSSLMNMIKDILEAEDGVKAIWFNPWKYDKKEDLWNALIQSILYRIVECSQDDAIKENARKLAKSTAWLLFKKGVSAVTAGLLSEKNMDSIAEAFVKRDEVHYQHINHFEEHFEKVVSQYTDNGKLIVFIDDLDRCLPENAITVLESLKLFIGNAKCVFVLGMDHHVIIDGINLRFSDKIKMSGRDYLDKIVQVPFFLPPVPFNRLRESLRDANAADYTDDIWELIELGLGANPRKTKRFVNCFYLLREILRHPATHPTTDVAGADGQIVRVDEQTQLFYLAKLLIFQMVFTDFYMHLRLYPHDWIFLEQEVTANNDPAGRERALNQHPRLKKIWENPYFQEFMIKSSQTHDNRFPEPPSGSVVESLLKAVSLIASSESGYASESEYEGPAQKRRMK